MIKVIVSGLPRSGTSFLTCLINRMGFDLGPEKWLKKGDEYNKFGYFECIPLNSISNNILQSICADFHFNLPNSDDLRRINLHKEKRKILEIVSKGNIELYKDNKLIVLSDIYHELFPKAKWVYISRSIEETYKSRFGKPVTFEEWKSITEKRLQNWFSSAASKKALNIDYNDFFKDVYSTINKIENHLEIKLDDNKKQVCLKLFKPKSSDL